MTSEQLAACSKKKLEALAKRGGIAGWKAMRKEELVVALVRLQNRSRNSEPIPAANGKHAKVTPAKPVAVKAKPAAPKAMPQKTAARDTSSSPSSASLLEQRVERSKYETGAKDSANTAPALPQGYQKDRIVVMVRDPYWLHAYWEMTHQSIERAEAALGQDWHGAKHILRLLDVTANETTSTAERTVRDIEVQPGCSNWYVEVKDPPKSYRIDVGYVSKRGQFYAVTRSNVVNTPRPNASDTIDENWAEIDVKSADKIFAMSTGYDPANAPSSLELKELFEERLRRPMAAAPLSSVGLASNSADRSRAFWFQLDAELIVYGATEPNARVTLQGEPVKLRPDGTFTMRFSLPDGRQIIPAVASSADGIEERTIVLAVERNTKQLEPLLHSPGDEDE
ncbi:MAG: DUF4912 domain-containing protein [Gemmataceae bacterium]|nr:DUF4912 domain-containing protein [Gemmataceae bacterium]